MKQIFSIFAFFVFIGGIYAQAPQGINFQGVARNADTSPKPAGTTVNVEFKIWDAAQFGNLLYDEKQSPQTNGVGIFTCVIGTGSVQPGSGAFANIAWAAGQKYLEVFVDGQASARQLMVSVPYALYAASGNQGPQGPQGAQGPQGLQGPQGATGPQGPTGTAATNVNVSDDMPASFKTTARSAAWQTMESKLQVQAPSAGTYLILYTLRARNFTDQDLVFFRIANAVTGISYTSSVLMSPQNGLNDVSSTSFFITNLSQGEVVQVQEKMEGTGTTEVTFEDGRISLVKIQ